MDCYEIAKKEMEQNEKAVLFFLFKVILFIISGICVLLLILPH
jgi:hypothetical protein